jgi:hypothetical protein
MRMLQPFAERLGLEADEFIHSLEREIGFVELEVTPVPIGGIVVNGLLQCVTPDQHQPPGCEIQENVEAERIVEAHPARRRGHDGGKVRRVPAHRRPLSVADVGKTARAHFSVAIRLLREPLHDIVAVIGVAEERCVVALGIAAPAHVDRNVGVSACRNRHAFRVLALRDIGREREDGRPGLLLVLRQIERAAQPHAIAHRDQYAPFDGDRILLLGFSGLVRHSGSSR